MPDGTYSLAVTTKNSAFANSGAYTGNYQTFSGKDVRAAVRAAVAAYAKANAYGAEAGAEARSKGKSRDGEGWSIAMSNSRANACVGDCDGGRAFQPRVETVRVDCTWEFRRKKLICIERE